MRWLGHRSCAVIILAFGTCVPSGRAQTEPPKTATAKAQSLTAQRCGVDQNGPPRHIFADPDGKQTWREYRSVKDVPELQNDAGEFVGVWASRDGSVLVSTQEPGEDFAAYTDYCFDSTGQLVQLRFQLRTAWGWGYREEGPIRNGILTAKMAEFFDTKTEGRIVRPEQAADIPDALKPRLYTRKSELPFFKLLSKN
jgi:hypothetical protein